MMVMIGRDKNQLTNPTAGFLCFADRASWYNYA